MASAVRNNAPRARALWQLKQWIDEGVLPDGQPLPTEQTLAQQLQVSRGTVRTALEILSEEGLIRSNGGRLRIVVAPHKSGSSLVRELDLIAPVTAQTQSKQDSRGEEQLIRIGILGAWTEQAQDYVWSNIAMRAMEKVASERSNVTLCYFNRVVEPDLPRRPLLEGVKTLQGQGVGRFVVLFRTLSEEIESLGAILDLEKTPLVCIQEQGVRALPVCQISYDIEHSGYQAAHHLLSRGWRSLVLFAPFEADWVWQRRQGIESAIRVHGLSPAEVLTIWPTAERQPLQNVSHTFQECGHKAGRELIKTMARPCGIIAPNDMTAYGVMNAAHEMQLTPGVDFGIIGFDDSSESRAYGLSSLRPPVEVMGEEAIRLLLSHQPNEQLALQICFRSELVARTSSALLRGTAATKNLPVMAI